MFHFVKRYPEKWLQNMTVLLGVIDKTKKLQNIAHLSPHKLNMTATSSLCQQYHQFCFN